jgi:hypothetical protein
MFGLRLPPFENREGWASLRVWRSLSLCNTKGGAAAEALSSVHERADFFCCLRASLSAVEYSKFLPAWPVGPVNVLTAATNTGIGSATECVFHVTISPGRDGVPSRVTNIVVVNSNASAALTGVNTITVSALPHHLP